MGTDKNKRIPIKDGLFTFPSSPEEKPQLLASDCPSCGEIIFPRHEMCPNCQERNLKDIKLSRKGSIYNYTTIMQRPASHYRGPVPYSFGWVELPEGVRVETLYTGCDFEELTVGMEVEVVIEKLHDDDDGNEIVCHMFRPTGK